jgi:hypothetical protein
MLGNCSTVSKGDSQVQYISFQNTAIRVEKGDVTIINCKSLAGNIDYSAIEATSSALVRAENCVVRGYLRGIYADGNAALKAYNNTCEGHISESGICTFRQCAGGGGEATPVATTAMHGIDADDQSRLVARNNTCEGNKQGGISAFRQCAGGGGSGNTCRNNLAETGLLPHREQSRLVARSNTCEGNKAVQGLRSSADAQGEVRGNNACRSNGSHGNAARTSNPALSLATTLVRGISELELLFSTVRRGRWRQHLSQQRLLRNLRGQPIPPCRPQQHL